jgi:predicted ATPase/class 3 adenylate cyclase/DNA-binding CsgD family transcriptional regulator/tetratricopeptide (TPR) repeat protein
MMGDMEHTGVVRALRPIGPSVPLPTGTVTFVLADIEGSVRLWEADRAAMTFAVRRLDGIVDEEVGRHRGVRPVEQGEGDSFVAAFAQATDAMEGTLAIQRAVAEEPWPGGIELRIRIAVHTGEAQLRDEANYVGNAINRAGRLRSLAHGGQVLVSPTTFELVADGLPDGAALRDLGLQRLRDLARPLRVYQLLHPSLPETFPPLRSLEVLTQNLPAPLSSFIGRETEMAEIEQALGATRLLTLTGSGGCGKTRLAIQAVRATADRYPDGMWFADLAAVQDPSAVSRVVLAALGRKEEPDRSVEDTLIEQLRPRQALLLLDNCEHLLGACARLTEVLLASCPALSILATSREPLRVEGEAAWRVPSMATPHVGSQNSLATYDAVRLFIDRAVQARSNFTVNNDNAPAVAAICQQLDGIPLAIELAAARVRSLTPEQIATGLSDRFRLLRGGARTSLPRQQTLSASVDWSHDLLDEPERILLRRLSVFVGGFTLDAAERVTATDGIDAYDVLDLISSFVDKSLVVMDEEEASARYRLLETIRQYAGDRLDAAGESDVIRERHAGWCADFADTAQSFLAGPDQATWFARLETEHDNLRAALDWAVVTPCPQVGLRIVASLTWFWNVHSHWHEAVRWADKLLAVSTDADGPLRDVAEWTAEGMRGMIGEVDVAITLMEQTAAHGRETGDHWLAAWSLNILGKYTSFTDATVGMSHMESALAEARHVGSASLLADTLCVCAWFDLASGQTASARARVDEGLQTSRAAGDARGELVNLVPRAAIASRCGDYASAVADLEAAMDLADTIGEPFLMAQALLIGGGVEMARGRYNKARELIEAGIEAGRETGSPFLASAGTVLAALDLVEGHAARALAGYEEEQRARGETNLWLYWLSPRPAGIVEAHHALGDLTSARACVEPMLEAASATDHTIEVAHLLLARARLTRSEGEGAGAEADAHAALAIFAPAEAVADALAALEVIASCAADQESVREAARLLGATDAIRAQFGCVRSGSDQAEYDATLQGVRARLDATDLASALEEGRGLSLEAVVTYARRGRGERKRPSTGWESLTPAELDVVKRVATGASNREIADALFISANTVKIHVSHVFSKLGLSSRSELAAAAVRRGI